MKLSIPEMSCGHCKATVQSTITGVDASAQVAVDLATRTAEVTSKASLPTLLAALKTAGYKATAA